MPHYVSFLLGSLLASALSGFVAIPSHAQPTTVDSTTVDSTLGSRTLDEWRDHLLPSSEDRLWETIPWLPSFSAGLVSADREQRPLLLWLMNGHPLGCT